MPLPERAQAETPGGFFTLPEQFRSRSFLYRYASVRSRADAPSADELVADGWEIENTDPRYGTALCRKEIEE